MNTSDPKFEPLPARAGSAAGCCLREGPHDGTLASHGCGPSYCGVCGEWPASMTPKGKRCYMCWTRDIAAENPVPLPDGKQCLEDLASIGVPGAAEKLAERWPNVKNQTPPPMA